MDPLKQKFFEKASALKSEIKSFLKENGSTKVDEVTLSQVFGGARGIKMMLWETSRLDPITQRDTLDMLDRIASAENIAVVLVTHDHDIAAKWADRVISLA